MPTDDKPRSTALVILPFATSEQAEEFARIVTVQLTLGDAAPPFVLHGTAYEYRSKETGEQGQVIEVWPESNFDVFVGSKGESHHVLQRVTVEGSNEERTR